MGEALKATVMLSSGHQMPRIGFGTYKLVGTDVYKCIKAALGVGYRLFDTSNTFHNEGLLRIAFAGVKRDSFFLTLKVANGDYAINEIRVAAQRSIQKTATKYVDLLMLQSPLMRGFTINDPRNADARRVAWKVMEEMQKEGKARSIGVCFFDIPALEGILTNCEIPPAVNQIEMHPMMKDTKLVEFCQKKNIAIQASSPLARGQKELLLDPTICSVAMQLGKTSSQVALRWGFQKGFSVIPKSARLERIKENAQLDFTIPEKDMQLLDQLPSRHHVSWTTSTSEA